MNLVKITDCPNYDKIVNVLYLENDIISKLLIEYYQEYVFNIKSEKSKLKIDSIMSLYADKEDFYKYVQNYFDISNNNEIYDSYDKVIRKLVKVYQEYEINALKNIKNSRWL